MAKVKFLQLDDDNSEINILYYHNIPSLIILIL